MDREDRSGRGNERSNTSLITRKKWQVSSSSIIQHSMRNVSQKCPDEERKVEEYICRMQYSGSSKRERTEVYRRAKAKFDDMIKRNNDGTEPLKQKLARQRTKRTEQGKEVISSDDIQAYAVID